MKTQTRPEIRRLKEGNRDCGGDSHTGFAMRRAAPGVSGEIRDGERRVGEDKDEETKTGIRLRTGACVRAVIKAAAA